jgi:hypothetical protein
MSMNRATASSYLSASTRDAGINTGHNRKLGPWRCDRENVELGTVMFETEHGLPDIARVELSVTSPTLRCLVQALASAIGCNHPSTEDSSGVAISNRRSPSCGQPIAASNASSRAWSYPYRIAHR